MLQGSLTRVGARRGKIRFAGVSVAIALGLLLIVLSQIDSRFQVAYFVLLLALPVYMVVKRPNSLRFTGFTCVFSLSMVFLVLACCLEYLLSGNIGYLSNVLILLLKTFLMYAIGFMAASYITSIKEIKWIAFAFIFGAAVYAIWVYANYFPGITAWLSNQTYLFPSKNSFGQIAGVSSLCCFALCAKAKSPLLRVAGVISGFLFAMSALFMQCRTSIVALAVGVAVLLYFLRMKKVTISLFLLVLFAIALVPSVQGLIAHAFLIDAYQGADINAMSSGRIGAWRLALGALNGNYLLGLGEYYVDCLYLYVLANLGILGFAPIMVIWIGRIATSYSKASRGRAFRRSTLHLVLLSLTAFYFIESILEAQPPFGPGACSALFWLLCGFCDAEKHVCDSIQD